MVNKMSNVSLQSARALTKIKNTTNETATIIIVTREKVTLDPGQEIEFDGDLELG